MIPDSIRTEVEAAIGAIDNARPVGGGCIAHATRVDTRSGPYFVKWNDGEGGRSFEAEAAGLRMLRDAAPDDLLVPEVLGVRNAGIAPGFLLLAWIEPGRPTTDAWRRFGRTLAGMHRADAPGSRQYGFESDNWIGSKPQRNGWLESWPGFFGEKRLRAQAETVRQRGAWNASWNPLLDRVIERLPELLPEQPQPSVLHGDLWSGNALPATDGRFAVVDPAVYVGHREADLAMTELFGGFPNDFYDGYREAWPLEAGYEIRRDIYNLFHLINHLTHGPGYAGSVEGILRRFGSR